MATLQSVIEMNSYPYGCGVCPARYLTEKEADYCRSCHSISAASSIEDTLKERGKRYGEFEGHAEISQALQSVMRAAEKWEKLKPDQKEALIMIAHKIARVLNGDSLYIDNFRDIAGYATLIIKSLENTEGATDVTTTKVERTNGRWNSVEK